MLISLMSPSLLLRSTQYPISRLHLFLSSISRSPSLVSVSRLHIWLLSIVSISLSLCLSLLYLHLFLSISFSPSVISLFSFDILE